MRARHEHDSRHSLDDISGSPWPEADDESIIRSARGDARDELEDDSIANLDYHEAYALGMLKSVKAVPKLKRFGALVEWLRSPEQRSLSQAFALWIGRIIFPSCPANR